MKKITAISLAGIVGLLLACGVTTAQAANVSTGTKAAITFVDGDDTGTTDSSGSGGTDGSGGSGSGGSGGGTTDSSGTGGNSSGGIGGGGNSGGTNGSGGTSVTVPSGKKPIFPQTGEARASLLGIIGIAMIGGLVLFAWRRKKAQAN